MPWPRFLRSPAPAPTAEAAACPKEAAGATFCQIPLNDLQLGQCAMVRHLTLSDSDDNRLRTLGICPGRRVWMVRRGDPMVLKVMGTRIGLAAELAKHVTVEVCAPPFEALQAAQPADPATEVGP